jgi:hypothetical protein
MKQCLECGTQDAKTYKGKYCAKCASKLYRIKNPSYQKSYNRKRSTIDKAERLAKRRSNYQNQKETIKQRKKELRQLKPSIYKARDKRAKRSPKSRFKFSIKRAIERKLTWDITFEDYLCLIKTPCYYCNNLLGSQVETAVGLDRIKNDIGYQLDNVLPCCRACNVLRNDILTSEETKYVVAYILQLRNVTVLQQ